MYRAIFLFFILINTVYSLNIKSNSQIESKLFLQWINENFNVDKNKKLTIILYKKNEKEKNIFNKVEFRDKVYRVSTVKIADIGLKKGTEIQFVSPWKKTSYIWREKEYLYINGDDFFYNKNLENILILYLKKEFGEIFLEKNSEGKNEKKGVDLYFATNLLLLILGLGTVILGYVIRKSVKNGYGDPFKI